MARFVFPLPARQIYIHTFLGHARNTVLHAAVKEAAAQVDPVVLRNEMTDYVPATGLQVIQGSGVRDELVFVTPCILRQAPTVLGYYRLLLGISQKRFYTGTTGLSIFRSMEDRGVIRDPANSAIAALCAEMNDAITILVTESHAAIFERTSISCRC